MKNPKYLEWFILNYADSESRFDENGKVLFYEIH